METQPEAVEVLPLTLSYADIERQFGVGRIKVWRLVQSGEFPKPMKLGGRTLRWDTQDVLAWYREQKENAAA